MMKKLLRWLPAILVMAGIFTLSSFSSAELPDFGFWDTLIKKGGHVLGYSILALSFWYALGWEREKALLAFLLAAGYALSDEFHQSFVPGRHSSWLDALVIDNAGAGLALLAAWIIKKKR
jgi:VanZ family protein